MIKIGSTIKHYKTNKPYIITEDNAMFKIQGQWHRCFIYKPLYETDINQFVRPVIGFEDKFEETKQDD